MKLIRWTAHRGEFRESREIPPPRRKMEPCLHVGPVLCQVRLIKAATRCCWCLSAVGPPKLRRAKLLLMHERPAEPRQEMESTTGGCTSQWRRRQSSSVGCAGMKKCTYAGVRWMELTDCPKSLWRKKWRIYNRHVFRRITGRLKPEWGNIIGWQQ